MRTVYGHKYLEFLEKPNGSKVPLGYFASKQMKEISAVIFSNTATFGKVRALSKDPRNMWFQVVRYNERGIKPRHEFLHKKNYSETLLDGLQIFHNPYADAPLDYEIFKQTGVTQCSFDVEERIPVADAIDGTLLQRTLITLSSIPDDGESLLI